MSGDRGACGVCQADLTPENSSKLRSGKVVHIGCPGAVTENRFSVTSAEPVKAELPASQPAEIAPNAPPRKGRRMSIGGPKEAPDARCKTTGDGGCEGSGCMHDPKPNASQRTPDAAEEARVRAESAARMTQPGPRAEADRRGLSDYPQAMAEGARVAGEAWKSASAKMVTAFEGVKLPKVEVVREAGKPVRIHAVVESRGAYVSSSESLIPDETASVEPDDFEPPELCSVCKKPKSKRLGLVLSTGTHLRCKAAQVRAQAREAEVELKAEKDGVEEDLAEKEGEVAELKEAVEVVTAHPEIGDLAQRLIDDLQSPESLLRRWDEQAALLKEPPPRHHFGGAPDGGVLDVSPPREPGEQIHFFGLQEFGAYPFGKDRPETIVAICGRKTAAQTRELEPTVARLDEPKAGGQTSLLAQNCPDCVMNWTPEKRVFPAYVKPSQMQDLRSGTPQVAEPYVSPVTRTGGRSRSPRAGR